MISRLGPSNILHRHAVYVLSNPKENSRSWFCLMIHICSQYSLPSPKEILDSQQSRSSFKSLIECKAHDFWEQKLREDASRLPSSKYFKPKYYSLARPHPIWRFAGNNPYEVEKAMVQARFLSGRYRTCWLSRHWSWDSSGFCRLPNCHLDSPTHGTLEHLLIHCQDLQPARDRVLDLWSRAMETNPVFAPVFSKFWPTRTADSDSVQFILDCSVIQDIINLQQSEGQWILETLFYLTRTYCFSLHKARLRLMGKWSNW